MLRRIARVVALLTLALALLLPGARGASAALTATSATIQWTAPGDDSLSGTAFQYDVRISTAPIDTSNFANATSVAGAPAPQIAGTAQSMILGGLSPSTAYWCAIRTADEAGNWSGVSNIVSFTTASSSDSIRPAPLPLVLAATGASTVTLNWTATGDDSLSGTASQYELRWSTSAITGANWSAATLVTSGVPMPAAPGTTQASLVAGLNRGLDLWFAIRVRDEMNNWSALSNVVAVPHIVDAAPPAPPAGLAGAKEVAGVHLRWAPNSEPDLAGYHVYRSDAAGGSFARVDGSLLVNADFVDANAPDSVSLWYQVTAVDASQNESARSAAFRVWMHAAGISAVRLAAAYPNPSGLTDVVTLPLDVPATGPLDGRIDIVNSAGERVRTIELRGIVPGTTAILWDGRNEAGRQTAPGVYRALLRAGGVQQVARLVRR